jgi:type I restriction enzyme S subunit
MATFQKIKIKNHCEITSSKRIFADEYLSSGVPFYRGKEISEKQRSSAEVSDMIYISRDKFEEIKSKYGVPLKGDLLLTSVGTIGNPYLVKDNEEFYFKDGNLTWFRNFQGINGQWLYYWLLSPQGKSELNKCTIGSSQKAYTINLLYGLQVKLPDLPTQTRIASVLSAYDDLIENNEKRIKALEEMAQLLYTEWFVKFKFLGCEKVKMVDSGTEYGMVPEGGEVKRLGEILNVVRGCSYSSEEINDFVGDYYIVNLKSFNRGGGFRFDGAKYYSGSINDNQSLKTGDVVVAVTDMTNDRAVIARPARVPDIEGEITFSADVVKINSDVLPNSFLYQLLSNHRFTETTKQKANGANVLHLKPTAILEFVALIPEDQLLKKFDVFCEPVAREIDKLLNQNQNLIKTRDLLIPQLVTGRREFK